MLTFFDTWYIWQVSQCQVRIDDEIQNFNEASFGDGRIIVKVKSFPPRSIASNAYLSEYIHVQKWNTNILTHRFQLPTLNYHLEPYNYFNDKLNRLIPILFTKETQFSFVVCYSVFYPWGQVDNDDTNIDGRIFYHEFDTWSPWISAKTSVSIFNHLTLAATAWMTFIVKQVFDLLKLLTA